MSDIKGFVSRSVHKVNGDPLKASSLAEKMYMTVVGRDLSIGECWAISDEVRRQLGEFNRLSASKVSDTADAYKRMKG